MRLLYLAVFCLGGMTLGLALDVRPLPLLLLFLAAVPLSFLFVLARRSPWPVVLAAVLLAAFWRVEAGFDQSAFFELPEDSGQRQVTLSGRVIDDPEAKSRNIRFTLEVDTGDLGSLVPETPFPKTPFPLAPFKVLVYAEPPDSLVNRRNPPYFRYGDTVSATGLLQRPKPFQGFDYPTYLESKGISGVLWARQAEVGDPGQTDFFGTAQKLIFSVRRALAGSIERNMAAPESALAQALLLGLRGELPASVMNDFRDTGAAHLLAISGLHVGVVLGLVIFMASGTLGRRRQLYLLAPLIAIWLYALTSGLPVSVVRAGIMGSTVVAAMALGRPRRVLPALALAAAVMVGIDPKVLGQVSFQLSFAAVAGIALVLPYQPGLAAALSGPIARRGGWWNVLLARPISVIATAILVSAAASLATFPLVAFYFQRIPWLGIPVTLMALPVLPLALAGSLVTAVVGLAHPLAGQAAGWLAWIPLAYMLNLVSLAPKFASPGTWVGVPFLVCWYGLLGFGLLWPRAFRKLTDATKSLVRVPHRPQLGGGSTARVPVAIPRAWLGLMALAVAVGAVLWWQVLSGPDGMLHVYFFDVGQGDSTLIVTPKGRQVLVDGGPANLGAVDAVGGELPFLDKSVDLVVLTHLDADHSRGLLEVLGRYRVGGVLIGSASAGGDRPDAPLAAQWDAAIERGGLEPIEVENGYVIDLEPGSTPMVLLEVLNPQGEQTRRPSKDLNNNAVVVRLVYGEVSFLLASDIESEGENALARGSITSDGVLDSSLLKVAHHGSKTSTTQAFLDQVDPEIAVISVGAGNTYGHPHPDVVARLRESVDPDSIYRTDLHGSIEAVSDGVDIWIKTAR